MGARRRTTFAVAASLLLGFVVAPPAAAAPTSVAGLLDSLVVTAENTSAYDRAYFKHWTDADGDGCNTRAEVLKAESLIPTTQNSNCTVETGQWRSYYDGATWTLASDVDIDHMVALSEAWDSGAHSWTAAQREAFANDLDWPSSLVAVTDNVNQSKSDLDPAQWMPPLASAHCRYVTEWVEVKYRWDLTVDPAERDAIRSTLDARCPYATTEAPPKAGGAPPETGPLTPFTQIAAHPDFTGDGVGDLFAIDQAGRLFLHPGAGRGLLGEPVAYGTGWGALAVYGPGDWNGDRVGDLVATDAEGRLFLYPGDGSGGFRARSQIGHGWTGYRIVPAGDVDNNGTADLLGIDASSRLWLYPGNGLGGFRSRVQVGNGWSGFDLYAAGDMSRDGRADILSIDSAGRLWFYSGRGGGYFNKRIQVGYGWSGYAFASGGDFDSNGVQDLMGRDPQGRLWFYSGRASGTFATRVLVSTGW